jgi:hypothetical protein
VTPHNKYEKKRTEERKEKKRGREGKEERKGRRRTMLIFIFT